MLARWCRTAHRPLRGSHIKDDLLPKLKSRRPRPDTYLGPPGEPALVEAPERQSGADIRSRKNDGLSKRVFHPGLRSGMMSGSSMRTKRKLGGPERRESASTKASRPLSLAPAGECRSRNRSSCLGLMEKTANRRSIRLSTTRHDLRHWWRVR